MRSDDVALLHQDIVDEYSIKVLPLEDFKTTLFRPTEYTDCHETETQEDK